MQIFLSLSSALYVFSELCSEPNVLILPDLLYALFAGVYVQFMNSGCWVKGIALLWCLALIYAMIKWAITALISYQVMITSSVEGELVAVTSSEYFSRHLADLVSNYIINLETHYANLTSLDWGNFRYSWDNQISMLLLSVSLNVFQVWCKIKYWSRCRCCETISAFIMSMKSQPSRCSHHDLHKQALHILQPL